MIWLGIDRAAKTAAKQQQIMSEDVQSPHTQMALEIQTLETYSHAFSHKVYIYIHMYIYG